MQQPYMADNAKGESMMRWNGGGDGSDLVDGSAHGANQYGLVPAQQQYTQSAPAPSNSLTRRPTNQALVPTNPRSSYDSSVEPWTGFGDGSNALLQQTPGEGLIAQDNVEVLEEMAAKAKRESQSKRKQIPPFVQKLSSFLEERKNEDLIRWSEKGDSFIVLDEDEFAKTLIPELFKHNNYASFVRQLNMYGFHKRVGLSDNSMRASERKNKSPSEYYNPFFRRGHPNLLWLINKPKGGSKAKKGNKHIEGEGESDEDIGHDDAATQPPGTSTVPTGRPLPTSDSQPLQKKEMTLIREELGKLQRNNNDLYNQALMFQNQHDRHQNSINAILNFLANVFRKTLEDGSHQNVGDIISSLMTTNQGTQQSHQQGSIFDLGDLVQSQVDPTSSLAGTHKRARGLLPPIPNQNEAPKAGRSPSGASPSYHTMGNQNPETGHVTELLDGSDASPSLVQELEANPQERMMKIINDHNATNTSSMDLPEAAELVANAPDALNRDQRSKLVDFMSKQTSTPSSTAPSPAAPGQASAGAPPRGSAAGIPPPSLSPIMRSPTMTPPSLHQINSNQVDLGQLQRLQSEQDAKIHELSEMLGPLSPSGQIPGLADGHEGFLDPPNVDLDQYFDSSAFLDDTSYVADGNDFNFNLDPGGGIVDPLGASHGNVMAGAAGGGGDVPSPAGTEEILRDDFAGTANPDHDAKRRRIG
ncbi:HSF-type DNA-binding domain-containing protein [Hirsutella rhossiliensis]|uniref:HSF-type DNA-binding domain-containing protein n=1 Tax=Hirsutella rhossiliensis TaxID=111463 RepID=A0A9P8SLE4_9HYPO|nr:HSF-type DNA-binding domain-containing protein [Hirsutella rhossiliensis]KAH0966871.1 HSF-type DNA-binding domain-containing protein [Hirsutella rhossiliensis]